MDALKALHQRVSVNRLIPPAPSGEVLANIQRAALRAADHGRLRPWRFLVVEGEGLDRLGDLFVQASGESLTESEREKIAGKPHRAPMIIVAIAQTRELPKIPEIEQVISAGAAVQNMLNAAFCQGVGAMWRTGSLVYNSAVKKGLGLAESETIVGFLYLGTPEEGRIRQAPDLNTSDHFQQWPSD